MEIKMKKSTITNIIFISGLLFIIIQCFIFESMINNGLIPSMQFVNFSVFIYDLFYLCGCGILGIIGIIMTIIGAIRLHKQDK